MKSLFSLVIFSLVLVFAGCASGGKNIKPAVEEQPVFLEPPPAKVEVQHGIDPLLLQKMEEADASSKKK